MDPLRVVYDYYDCYGYDYYYYYYCGFCSEETLSKYQTGKKYEIFR